MRSASRGGCGGGAAGPRRDHAANDRPAPGAVAAPTRASPGRASQPITARAGDAPANQRPPSHNQPGRAGGRAAAGRSWARKRGAEARPSPPGSAPARAPVPASRKRGPWRLPSQSGGRSAPVQSGPVERAAVVRRRTWKRAFLLRAPSSAYCVQETRGRRDRGPALGGHWEQSSLAAAYGALPRLKLGGLCVQLLCLLMRGASEEDRLTPRNSCPPEGEDAKRMRVTLGCTMRCGERLISARRRARS